MDKEIKYLERGRVEDRADGSRKSGHVTPPCAGI